jgi:glyoxylase I family protein
MSGIKPRGIVHFTIPVSDLAASRAFYTEVLGLTLVRHSDEHQMTFLTAGKDYVVLAKSDTPIEPNLGAGTRVHHAFALAPAAWDDARGYLESLGVTIIHVEHRKSGTFPSRQIYIHDPDRNVIELTDWAGRNSCSRPKAGRKTRGGSRTALRSARATSWLRHYRLPTSAPCRPDMQHFAGTP